MFQQEKWEKGMLKKLKEKRPTCRVFKICHIMTEESIGFDNWAVAGKHYQTPLIDYERDPG